MPFASISSAAFRTLIAGVAEMTFLVMMSFANMGNLLRRCLILSGTGGESDNAALDGHGYARGIHARFEIQRVKDLCFRRLSSMARSSSQTDDGILTRRELSDFDFCQLPRRARKPPPLAS